MHSLDGSSGGGQLLRSAVSLSALSGEPFRMTGIRASRSNPGLRPQHLAAVHAVARACNAELYGNTIGSEALTFRPKAADGGKFSIDVETAGSTALVFDALLPLAVTLDEPLSVTVTGGTDVRWSPTVDYFREVKLPLCRRFGLLAGVEVTRTGYYPAGGGEATLWVAPSSLSAINLAERRELTGVRIYSKASTSLAEQNVAERQAETARDRLGSAGHLVLERRTTYAKSDSTGSSLLVRAEYSEMDENYTVAGFDGLGERGVPAEDIAKRVVGAFSAFHDGRGVVDEHMADQLVIFLALAGGRVTIPKITPHIETSLELLAAFGYDVSLVREPNPMLIGE
ncbi:RNA 3'-terminal phosphate cyclase (ATP) [Haladaptatus litoreus]|uniref:RNA 3'-terminal phosphate cyclase n=1 Tax=Haladaptatus litoreus TaxID=553468 RepID=A0A1N7C4L4_9EURY|nr:RNA 3'-terminal phosphate cyclase [Haladaptatus litoreus]SIR58394.1 RNA 3'-terminal phosphate cyclase (ATP) [Haladaptatus litoreus]